MNDKLNADLNHAEPSGTVEDAGQTGIGENAETGKKSRPPEEMSKEELLQALKGVQESADRNFDLYLRAQAEMENLKKRFQKEKEGLIRYSNESLIKQLLPVLDNLESALGHAEDEKAVDALREGIALTLKGFKDTLSREGVKDVKAVGEAFDPHFHEAISEQENASVEPRTVLHELQKGYLLNDRLIRPAVVVVSRNTGGD